MNTLTDLRRTLDEHAAEVTDPAAVARTASIRHRVTVVRRRRRAVAAGAVSLVLLAAVAATVIPRATTQPQPAAPTLLGQKAPDWVKSLGFHYDTDGRGYTFHGAGTIQVKASDKPQLFSWTTSLKTRVAIELPDHRTWYSPLSGFEDFVVIPPGQGGALGFEAVKGGDVAVASYQLSGEPPDGYSHDGVTFRSDVAGASLLRGLVPGQGATGASSTFVAPQGQVSLAVVCSGLPKGDTLHVAFAGHEASSVDPASCDPGKFWDAGTHEVARFQGVGTPGQPVRLRVWVTAGQDSATQLPARSAPDLKMGIGVYGPVPLERVGGTPVPASVEYLGHTFMLGSSMSTDLTARAWAHLTPYRNGQPVVVAWSRPGRTETLKVTYRAGSESDGVTSRGVGGGSLPGLWAPAGSTPTARLTQGTARLGIGAYVRAD
ncbi:MAG: hypothetical protein WAV00_07040 [Nocardioides sp.]